MHLNRRDFMKSIALSLGAVALAPVIKIQQVFAADAKGTAVANALAYVEDADAAAKSKDAKEKDKVKTRKKGEYCNNCQYFQSADRKAAKAPCTLMGGADVANKGWCRSWAKMAKK